MSEFVGELWRSLRGVPAGCVSYLISPTSISSFHSPSYSEALLLLDSLPLLLLDDPCTQQHVAVQAGTMRPPRQGLPPVVLAIRTNFIAEP